VTYTIRPNLVGLPFEAQVNFASHSVTLHNN